LNHTEIKRLRLEQDKTQIDICRAVGVSLAAYRNWELGAGQPTPENLKKLKNVLGVK